MRGHGGDDVPEAHLSREKKVQGDDKKWEEKAYGEIAATRSELFAVGRITDVKYCVCMSRHRLNWKQIETRVDYLLRRWEEKLTSTHLVTGRTLKTDSG